MASRNKADSRYSSKSINYRITVSEETQTSPDTHTSPMISQIIQASMRKSLTILLNTFVKEVKSIVI